VIDCVCRVIRRDGLPGLSLRAVAAETGISPSTLLHQFTDRARLVRVAAATVGAARNRYLSFRAGNAGILAFVPASERSLDEPALDALAGVVDGVVASMFTIEYALTRERAEAALRAFGRAMALPEKALPDQGGPVTSAS
jgi:AcrR family transcriptional regulator